MLRELGQSIRSNGKINSGRCTNTLAVLQSIVCILLVLSTGSALAQGQLALATDSHTPAPTLVIGFMGGFVHSDDLRHSEAQLAQRLEESYGDHVLVEMFENRHRAQARESIVDWVNRLEAARITGEAIPQPRINLFGHSWGASAVVYLARELEREGIPVALTIQVDSVRKHGEDDSVIPPNVVEAINFYQPNGILHGQSRIKAADPTHTTILGNYRLAYEREPAACHACPWYNRLLFKGHTSIECDPQVWSQIQVLIASRLPLTIVPQPIQVAAQFAK